MVYILLADGFEEIEALTPLDLLRRAGVETRTVSVSGSAVVHGAHGIDVVADLMPNEVSAAPTLVFLPGGMPGALNLDASPVTDKMLTWAKESGTHIAAICAAPLVLGRRGLLRGKRATCYPGFEAELVGAAQIGGRVVTDGNITTAVGMGAAEEFAAELVRILAGKQKADAVLSAIHART